MSYDLEFFPDKNEMEDINIILLVISSVSTLMLMYSIVWRYKCMLEFKKSKGTHESMDDL